MDEIDTGIGRRNLLIAGGLATLVVGVAGTASAAGGADTKGNAKVVADFIAAWNDPDKAVTFLADNCSVRMEEDKPAITGPANVAAAFKGFMGHGEKLDVKILKTYAEGPLVTNKRIDTLTNPGQKPQAFPVVGVFIVKKGKIAEWTDYLDT